jgi:hypothetical protein
MATINDLKELEVPGTPLLLFTCTLPSGDIQRWSTHTVTVDGNIYAGRVLAHNVFDLRSSSDAVTDGISKLSITLANSDRYLAPFERSVGWKGSVLTVTLQFLDVCSGKLISDSSVVFRGIANPPDESLEATLRLSFTNSVNSG